MLKYIPRFTPMLVRGRVPTLNNVSSISRYGTAFYVISDGALYVSGANSNGELGTGDLNAVDGFIHITTAKLTNGTTVTLPRIKEVYSFLSFTFLIAENGELYAAGNDLLGRLGLGGRQSAPYDTVPYFTYVRNGVKKVAGGFTTYLLTTSNELYACGRARSGTMGGVVTVDQNRFQRILTNVLDFDQYYNGSDSVGAFKTNGAYVVTGGNPYGVLGTGDAKAVTSWSQLFSSGYVNGNAPARVKIGNSGSFLYGRYGENNYAVARGTHRSSGANTHYGLGMNETQDYLSFISLSRQQVRLVEFAYNVGTLMVVGEDAQLYVAGVNFEGGLGLGHKNPVPYWTPVPGMSGVSEIFLYSNEVWIVANGDLYFAGKLGASDQFSTGVPGLVESTTFVKVLSDGVSSFVAGGFARFALKEGNLYHCGGNTNYIYGDPAMSAVHTWSPV